MEPLKGMQNLTLLAMENNNLRTLFLRPIDGAEHPDRRPIAEDFDGQVEDFEERRKDQQDGFHDRNRHELETARNKVLSMKISLSVLFVSSFISC